MRIVAAMVLSCLSFTAPVSGSAEVPAWENDNGAAIYVLESASARALALARMNKGARECWCLMKNVELKELIQRIEHGQPVTFQEIVDAVDGLLAPESTYRPGAFAGCQ